MSDEATTLCESCGEEIDVKESTSCQICGLNPLCQACSGEFDHDCLTEE